MDYSQPFSVLNQKLKPPFTSEQLYSSLERVEERQLGSLRSKSPSYQDTVLSAELEPKVAVTVTVTEAEDPEEPEDGAEQEDLVSDGLEEANCADPLPVINITELNLKNMGEEESVDEDSSTSQSEEKDSPDELTSEGRKDSSESEAVAGEGGRTLQRSYIDRTLPDLINSGRPLIRRKTLGHVSATLSEVRREVELSRRRSIKLKAQVDKLQKNRDGPGWSRHRERVTEEILSILRLLRPLTEQESSTPEPSQGEGCLDNALNQLQNVARELAISHTKHESKTGEGKEAEESAILQQALRDRDEAIEKKKAMEAELLKSKTELMLLNNHLLEAVQKRLELSLELEAWKEDVQLIIQQQLQSQQRAEQTQKKGSRLGILRRHNKPSIQKPSSFPLPTPTPPTVNSNQIYVSSSALAVAPTPSTSPSNGTQRNWMDKLRRGKSSRSPDQDVHGQDSEGGKDDGFQVVSLD